VGQIEHEAHRSWHELRLAIGTVAIQDHPLVTDCDSSPRASNGAVRPIDSLSMPWSARALEAWGTVAKRAPLPPSHALVAPDSFKGTLSAPEVAAAIARGLEAGGAPPADVCPIADGGEGTAEILLGALGGQMVPARAADPLGRVVDAHFGLVEEGRTAIVEVAAASGLGRTAVEERDPVAASSAGTGELIAAAVEAGARSILVAAGGSATTDGGAGALAAIRRAGGLGEARLVVLCDVRTPFEMAAARFAPQKGADPAAVRRLTERLRRQARALPRDPRGVPMTGAAGGLAGGLWAAHGATLVPGAAYVLDALGVDERMRAARAVIVGEGCLDRTTLEGKAAGELAVRARQAGVPAHAVVGVNALDRFDARILDLQTILEARTVAELERAGAEMAATI
jgi:glycerate kinase